MQHVDSAVIKNIINLLKIRRALFVLNKCTKADNLRAVQGRYQQKRSNSTIRAATRTRTTTTTTLPLSSKNKAFVNFYQQKELSNHLLRQAIVNAIQIPNYKCVKHNLQENNNIQHKNSNNNNSSVCENVNFSKQIAVERNLCNTTKHNVYKNNNSQLQRYRQEHQPKLCKVLAPRANIGSLLQGRQLQQLDLTSLAITANFNRSDLARSKWENAFVAHSTFNLCQLSHASFNKAQFHSCTFVGACGNYISASHTRFAHCVFRRAQLLNWNVCGATFYKCTFTQCEMSNWVFDTTTNVIQPVDWHQCRRLNWLPSILASHTNVQSKKYNQGNKSYYCNVIGVAPHKSHSLPPPDVAD